MIPKVKVTRHKLSRGLFHVTSHIKVLGVEVLQRACKLQRTIFLTASVNGKGLKIEQEIKD